MCLFHHVIGLNACLVALILAVHIYILEEPAKNVLEV